MAFCSSMVRTVGVHLLAVLCAGAFLGVGPGPGSSPETVQEHLRVRIEAINNDMPGALSVGDERIFAAPAVARYYRRTAFKPIWARSVGPAVFTDSLLTVLRDADRDGLRSADYHIAALDSLLQHLRARAGAGEPLDPRRIVDLELLCTDAFLLYGSHLLAGRVDPTGVTPRWTADERQADLVKHLEQARTHSSLQASLTDLRPLQPEQGASRRALARYRTLDETGGRPPISSLRASLAKLRPPDPEYDALRRALARYRSLDEAGGWPSIPDGPKLEMGTRDGRVPLLRRRLQTTEDLSVAAAPEDSLLVDTTLHRAVEHFQERHGLTVDGVVGPSTRSALNMPVEKRIRQIKINLERWRWLPETLGRLHVRVNIAGFNLRVVKAGTDLTQMRVIVGQDYRQTPVFSDRISYLVLNPSWHVPQSIAVKDKLPDFRRDPSLLSEGGYEVFRGWGVDATQVDPSTIDWNAVSATDFPYRLRQAPGPQNALGQIKFMFPNDHSVYLHDTPSPYLFSQTERSFSSGCVRVERPLDLAAVLLRNNEDWGRERLKSTVGAGTKQTVVFEKKTPVHILYWTSWSPADGPVQFRRDVYDRDAAVHAALTAPLGRQLGRDVDAK